MKHTNKNIFITAIFITALFGLFMLPSRPSQAGAKLVNSKSQLYAGKVDKMTPCECSGGFQVIIKGGRSPGNYLYVPGETKAFKNRAISAGRFIMGRRSSGGECVITPPDCKETLDVSGGTISSFGSSPF